MPNFRKKPVVIEAIQLTEYNIREVYCFIYGSDSVTLGSKIAEDKWEDYCNSVRLNGFRLKTLESDNETQVATIGDFVIKGVQGEFYPCKPDIFEKTYEPAE